MYPGLDCDALRYQNERAFSQKNAILQSLLHSQISARSYASLDNGGQEGICSIVAKKKKNVS
jgi:hypothetical protein